MKPPTAKDRHLVKLYRERGMMTREIAALIGRTVPSVEWIIKRAMREGYMSPLGEEQKGQILSRRAFALWDGLLKSERKARTRAANQSLEKKRKSLVAVAAIATSLSVTSIPTDAHDYAHPELKSWFMGLHNSQGTPCCDGEDAVHIEDVDWGTECKNNECHYKVRLEGKWYDVPHSAEVYGPNKAPTALVWPIRYGHPDGSVDYAIRCFLPGTGT